MTKKYTNMTKRLGGEGKEKKRKGKIRIILVSH